MSSSWVLTGEGLISAAGDTSGQLFAAMLSAESAVSPLDDESFPAAHVRDFAPRDYVKRKGLKWLSRASQLSCAAASRLTDGLAELSPEDVGVVLGSAWASLDTVVRFEREAHLDGPRFVDPVLFTETVANVPAGQISIFFGWSALNATLSAGTASGLEALRTAIDMLDEGRARAIVAGGSDELNRHLLRTLHAEEQTAASAADLPFDESARGPIGGEGACLFVVESETHARARRAPVLARISAAPGRFIDGNSRDAGAERVATLRELFDSAGLDSRDIDLVVLSGNGEPARERTEAALIGELFGSDSPPAVAPKAIIGETWGASGPLGVAVACEAIRSGTIPHAPTALRPRFTQPSFPRETLRQRVRHALVLDCAASGPFAAVIVSLPEAAT